MRHLLLVLWLSIARVWTSAQQSVAAMRYKEAHYLERVRVEHDTAEALHAMELLA